MSKEKFYRNSLMMSAVVFVSRIFGFVRDMITAAFFGTSTVSDAYFAAFRIPNTLRSLLGEGAFNSAFIPLYSDYIAAGDRKKQALFLGNVLVRFSFVLFVLSLCFMLFSKEIILFISFLAPEKEAFIELAARLLKVTSWYLLLVGLASFFMAIQQANDSFAKAAAGQIVFNIGFIAVLLLLFRINDDLKRVYVASFGVIAAGLCQMAYQMNEVIRLKVPFMLNLKHENHSMKRLLRIMAPAIFGQAIIEINLLADSIFALLISTGAVTALYYASRIMQLPIGIFSVSIATVSLTIFSKNIARNESIREGLNTSIKSLSYIILPVTSYLIGGGLYIIRILFERGNFTYESSAHTAALLLYFSMGIIFFSFVKLFAQIFYAHKSVKYPVIFTSVSMILNIEFVMIFTRYLGAGGIALATSLSTAVNFTLLYAYSEKFYGLKPDFTPFFKLLPIAVSVSLLLLFLRGPIEGLIPIKHVFLKNVLMAGIYFILNLLPYFILIKPSDILAFRKRMQNT